MAHFGMCMVFWRFYDTRIDSCLITLACVENWFIIVFPYRVSSPQLVEKDHELAMRFHMRRSVR